MNILAIDSATSILSIALSCAEERWCFEADAGLRHSELLMDGVDMLVKKADIKPNDIDGVLCMGGPGSFTGLRIGFSAAKGLALSLGIPFAPIPTLDCIAMPYSVWPGLVLPVIDARKNAFFCALFNGQTRLCPDIDADSGQIARIINEKNTDNLNILLTGHDAEKLYEMLLQESFPAGFLQLAPQGRRGYAATLLDIAKKSKVFDENNHPWLFKGPEYIRKSDAELNNLPGSL